MAAYDIAEAFAVIEDYLIDSLRRNLMRHIGEERREGINWSQWQAEMLYGLTEFKRVNTKMFDRVYPAISEKIDAAIWEAYDTGEAAQEQAILSAIRLGFKPNRPKDTATAEFFRLNRRKMNALITETKRSMQKAQYAALRMTEDQYRSIIFGAQVFYNAGAGTLWQAVDMASKKFLASGINCIEYKNGARVNIASYAEMALRTANTRAYLHGEAAKREQYGIHTVIVNRHNAACPLCVPFQGRVFIDDVWGSGTAAEAKVQGYPLLSDAIAGGLYHPNCKDSHTTFFVGINRARFPTERMKAEQIRRYRLQQEQRYHERNIRKYKRLYRGTVDEKQRVKYARKLHEWQDRTRQLVDANPKILRRSPPREQLRDIPEELGITPPRQPPGIEIQARQPPPKKPDHHIQIVIDTTATDTPPKARALPDTAAAERQRDIEKIRAKTRLVTQKAKEMAQEAQAARLRAQAAQTRAQAATQKAHAAREQVKVIRTGAHLRDKRISAQMLDARLAIAEAKKLRSIAEIKKTEARAAMRRCSTLMRMANGGRLVVSVKTKTVRQIPVTVKPPPRTKKIVATVVQPKIKTREEMMQTIRAQDWQRQVKPEQRDDIDRLFASMDEKRLRFWDRYGNLIKGNLLYKGRAYHDNKRIFLDLAKADPRSQVLGYRYANTRVLLHETGHLLDEVFKIHEHLPELESKMRNDFLNYVDNLLGTQKRFDAPMLRDEMKGIYKSLDHYHLFTEREKESIRRHLVGIEKDTRHLRNGVMDLIGGLTGNEIELSYRHSLDYWDSDHELLLMEAVAHMFEAYMNGGVKYSEFNKFFPESMRYFEEYFEKLM